MGNSIAKQDLHVVIMGLDGSGKSAIVGRFLKDKFIYEDGNKEDQQKKQQQQHSRDGSGSDNTSLSPASPLAYTPTTESHRLYKTSLVGRKLTICELGGSNTHRAQWPQYISSAYRSNPASNGGGGGGGGGFNSYYGSDSPSSAASSSSPSSSSASPKLTGIIYVIDGSDRGRLHEATSELVSALSSTAFRTFEGSAEVPIAVFVNKQDVSDNGFMLKAEEVQRAMDLNRQIANVSFTPSSSPPASPFGKSSRKSSEATSSNFSFSTKRQKSNNSFGAFGDPNQSARNARTMLDDYQEAQRQEQSQLDHRNGNVSPNALNFGALPSSSSQRQTSLFGEDNSSYERPISYFDVSARSGEGIREGFKWLCRAAKSGLKERVAQQKALAKEEKQQEAAEKRKKKEAETVAKQKQKPVRFD